MASPHIAFDTLPASIRKPGKYIEFNTRLAVRTLPANAQRLLLLAQTVLAAPLEPVQMYSDEQAAVLCGYGSQAHLMVRAAIKANPYLDLTLLPVADASAGIAASGSLALTGTATSQGVLILHVDDTSVAIAVSGGDTAAQAAADLLTALQDKADLPITATVGSVEGGTLTIKAKNKGTLGNSIILRYESTAAGLSGTLTPMVGGQQDPAIEAALASVFAEHYTIISIPWAVQAQLVALREHINATGHALEQRGAIGVCASTSTLAQNTTLAGLINAGRLTLACLPATLSPPCRVSAAYAAVLASEEDPARPLNTLPLIGIAAPPVEKRLSRNEQEIALKNGITPLEVGAGEVVQIVRALSTYTRNAENVTDVSLLDITTIRTLDYVRKAVRERISLRFPREKLSARTPAKVRSEILDVLRKMEELEILEEVEANAEGVICERDSQDVNRLNAKIPADVVNGLHVFAGRIDLLL
ncbi:MAG: phage tail sheath C-terminal domain-containing protein [Desulfovibrionaceae bacterium]